MTRYNTQHVSLICSLNTAVQQAVWYTDLSIRKQSPFLIESQAAACGPDALWLQLQVCERHHRCQSFNKLPPSQFSYFLHFSLSGPFFPRDSQSSVSFTPRHLLCDLDVNICLTLSLFLFLLCFVFSLHFTTANYPQS